MTTLNPVTQKHKLIWQIFPAFILITVLSLLVTAWYSNQHFKKFFIENSEKELSVRARLILSKFEDLFLSKNLIASKEEWIKADKLCKQIGVATSTRVTLINKTGEVIADSFGKIDTMESHEERPEIHKALKGKKGISIRYSETLDDKLMYIALPVFDNQHKIIAVVRAAIPISSIDQRIRSVRNKTIITIMLITILATIVSLFVSRKIIRPLKKLKDGAMKFANGDLSGRLPLSTIEEFSGLAQALNTMAENLDEKITDAQNRRNELEAVHSSMKEGVVAIDRQEKIITINNTAAEIFGFPVKQLVKRNVIEVARNFELQSFIQKALETHEPVEEDIMIHQEDERILQSQSTTLYDIHKKRMGTLIIFHDITRIRRLESIQKAFAANVSHELKTPLTTIKGFIETLQELIPPRENLSEFLEIIEKNVNRMIDLINDLLSLARLERMEGSDIELQEHCINGLIRTVLGTCSPMAEKKQISVEIRCPENLKAMIDPILMEQALFNLVDNAIKYSLEHSKIFIQAQEFSSNIEIQISDSGIGIPKKDLPYIFNRFYRVDKARSRHNGGTGLGLAIVKHIIQYHNGKIDVESSRGIGTRFYITLPA